MSITLNLPKLDCHNRAQVNINHKRRHNMSERMLRSNTIHWIKEQASVAAVVLSGPVMSTLPDQDMKL
jgi:hypothetical protein